LVDAEIRAKTKELVCVGKDVILDYGFWSKEVRKEYYNWGIDFAEDVVFCIVKCDLTEAKRRVLLRTKDNSEELFIDEDFFDAMAVKFEPFEEEEGYTFLYV
jgi:predicted kinase